MSQARRVSPWTKKTDELVRYVAVGCGPGLMLELGHWIEHNPAFAGFLDANRDKIRKKLRTSPTEDARLDVRAELLTARLVLAHPRFELAFEAYGAGQRGPDLSVTYRAHAHFNLEVTRVRAPAEADVQRVASLIARKVRQFPAEIANALVITGAGPSTITEHLAAAVGLLKVHTNARNDAYFAARGVADAREFYAHFVRLAGVVVISESGAQTSIQYTPNRDARRALPSQALARLLSSNEGRG
jgi:hypothetical protein